MSHNYRLKKEAVPFFNDELARTIKTMDRWRELGADDNALEKVEDVYVSSGIQTSENASSVAGWSQKYGSHFHFTINFPSVKWEENDRFTNGKHSRELMDKIQRAVSDFYLDFVNES